MCPAHSFGGSTMVIQHPALPSRSVLEEMPERALAFLAAVGQVPMIRAALAAHGYTRAALDHLRQLIATAQKGTAATATPLDTRAETAREEREQALVDLYYWHKDWATTARAVIARRDHLIRLG